LFKSENRKSILEWYSKRLGISIVGKSVVFQWKQKDYPNEFGHTVWAPFNRVTKYFHPSEKDFMINYRVDDLEALIKQLKNEGVEIVGEIERYDYGKFDWIMDPEGNKIELWEPNDEVFRRMNRIEGQS